VSDKQAQLARRLYLDGFAYAATEVARLSKWEAEERERMSLWADYTPTYLPTDSLREHAINAALMAWDHGEHGHFAQGLAAGYYAALGEEA
jgi:hypothetical protein